MKSSGLRVAALILMLVLMTVTLTGCKSKVPYGTWKLNSEESTGNLPDWIFNVTGWVHDVLNTIGMDITFTFDDFECAIGCDIFGISVDAVSYEYKIVDNKIVIRDFGTYDYKIKKDTLILSDANSKTYFTKK